jgi:uncharacterized protein (UPF0276 family)
MEATPFPHGLDRPAVGLAYSLYVSGFAERHPNLVDYIEIPFELIRYDSSVLPGIIGVRPLVLHCASLSVAGFIPPSQSTIEAVRECICALDSPWLGEHLAFLTADPLGAFDEILLGDSETETNVGYTVSPICNHETLEQVVRSLDSCKQEYSVPTILENGPVYLRYADSEMSESEFIRTVSDETGIKLLLDLTHFCITCRNTGRDPLIELENFPVERVHEVHISGLVKEAGVYWDNHATLAPAIVYRLLTQVLSRVTPAAITLEYNWSPHFPETSLLREFDRIFNVIG